MLYCAVKSFQSLCAEGDWKRTKKENNLPGKSGALAIIFFFQVQSEKDLVTNIFNIHANFRG